MFASTIAIHLSLAITATAMNQQIVKVRSYNRIFDAQKITLADIIDTHNLDGESVRSLKKINLGDAPKMGEQRVFTNKAIAELARKDSVRKSWVLQIPQSVTIDNRGYDLHKESIEKELVAQWNGICPDCDFKINNMQLPVIPKKLTQIPWQLESDSRLPRGYYTRKLSLTSDNGRIHIFWINGQVEIRKKVPTLSRNLSMNTRINEDDIELQWRDITFATDSTPALKDIIGQKIKYTMNANDIIWNQSLVREKAVHRGESVKVTLMDENWNVSVNAVLEEDGFIGDTVNLRNPHTNKKITGKVIGLGEVEIR